MVEGDLPHADDDILGIPRLSAKRRPDRHGRAVVRVDARQENDLLAVRRRPRAGETSQSPQADRDTVASGPSVLSSETVVSPCVMRQA